MLEASEGKLRPVSVCGCGLRETPVNVCNYRSVASHRTPATSQVPLEAPPPTKEEPFLLLASLDRPSLELLRVELVSVGEGSGGRGGPVVYSFTSFLVE